MISEDKMKEYIDGVLFRNRYSLEKVYKKYIPTKETNVDSILIEIRSGGSDGGNCYGSYTARFDVSSKEMTQDLAESLCSHNLRTMLIEAGYEEFYNSYNSVSEQAKMPCFADAASRHAWDRVGSYSEGGDAYGNHTEYEVIAVKFEELMKNVLKPEDFTIFMNVYPEMALAEHTAIEQLAKNAMLKEVNEKIAIFSESKTKEYSDTQRDIERLKKQILQLEKKLVDFNKDKKKQLQKLETERDTLLEQGAVVEVPKDKKRNRH